MGAGWNRETGKGKKAKVFHIFKRDFDDMQHSKCAHCMSNAHVREMLARWVRVVD